MKNLKKSMLTKETITCLEGVKLHLAKMAFKENPKFLFERFEIVRSKEEWSKEDVEFLILFLGQVAYCYNPSAPYELRETQVLADKAMRGVMKASSDDTKSDGKEYQFFACQYVQLSERSLNYLRQVYPDIYLKRHEDHKFQRVVDAIPHIQSSQEVMGWFIARIVNVSNGHKKLRQALEADLKAAGLKLVESEESYGVVPEELSSEEVISLKEKFDGLLNKGGQS